MKVNREKTILKLRDIFKGEKYVPCRGLKDYDKKRNAAIINCLGHAFFNLLDSHFEVYQITKKDSKAFRHFVDYRKDTPEDTFKEIAKFVGDVGLKVRQTDSKALPKENEWKIAYYYNPYQSDYHFMLLEKDGRWSSKMSSCTVVASFDTPPEYLYDDYKLEGFYMIKNPYAENIDENEVENF